MSLRLEQELWGEVPKNRVESIKAEGTFPWQRGGWEGGPDVQVLGLLHPLSYAHRMSHRAHARPGTRVNARRLCGWTQVGKAVGGECLVVPGSDHLRTGMCTLVPPPSPALTAPAWRGQKRELVFR